MGSKVEDMEAAELLAAFGGAHGPLKLERRALPLSAVAEEAEPVGLAETSRQFDSGPIQPVAEHPPTSSLQSTQDVHSPNGLTGSMIHRQQSLTASVLSLPAASAPMPPGPQPLRSSGGSGAFSPVQPTPKDGLAAAAAANAAGVGGGPRELFPSPSHLAGPGGKSGNSMFVGPSRPRSAAARALLAGTTLHPVVQLGWQPLCEVHCNGLTGFFLGGHDRDLYIKCTAPEFANLPMVDVMQGGCIMTCSHFEKAAGRELSKKWKESIHVAGEGEGSKATLVAWLKRRAEADYGPGVVGKHVWICWCADAEYYWAEILAYSRDTGKHKVKYADRFTEDLHLPVEKLAWGPSKPAIAFNPAETGFAHLLDAEAQRAASGLQGIARSRSAPAATLRSYAAGYAASLLHQASTASTCYDEDARAVAMEARTPEQPPRSGRPHNGSPPTVPRGRSVAILAEDGAGEAFARPQPVPPVRRRRTGLSGSAGGPAASANADSPGSGANHGDVATSGSASEGSDGTPVGPPPKKRRHRGTEQFSAPASSALPAEGWLAPPLLPQLSRLGGLAGSGALEAVAEGSPRSARAPLPGALRDLLPEPAPLGKRQASLSGWLPDQVLPDLSVAAAPPAAGFEEINPSTMSRWMSRIAMHLDDSLELRASASRSEVTESAARNSAVSRDAAKAATSSGGGNGGSGGSGGGSVQSPSARFQTLLVYARRRDCLTGYYEAMLERFHFFKADPAKLRQKLEDFIWATLAEDRVQHERELAFLARERAAPATDAGHQA